MKISSLSKIKKQSERYANENFKPSPTLLIELSELEIEQNKLSKQWANLRDSFCNGEPCICITHPRHKEFFDKLEPINTRVSAIYRQISYEKRSLQNAKERQLLQTRAAKENYIHEKI